MLSGIKQEKKKLRLLKIPTGLRIAAREIVMQKVDMQRNSQYWLSLFITSAQINTLSQTKPVLQYLTVHRSTSQFDSLKQEVENFFVLEHGDARTPYSQGLVSFALIIRERNK